MNKEFTNILSNISKKTKKSVGQLKPFLDKSIKLAEDFFGIDQDKFGKEELEYVEETMKNFLNVKENLTLSFIKSKMKLKEFVDTRFKEDGTGIASGSIAVNSAEADKALGQNTITRKQGDDEDEKQEKCDKK